MTPPTLCGRELIPGADVLLVTLDTLRYDAAQAAFEAGELPTLAELLPADGWEPRHAPGSFTYSSHHAIFAGFLPTPIEPGNHQRLFALSFEGSTTSGPDTVVLDAPNVPTGLRDLGYRTVCIGGVGFFNNQTPLGRVLPDMFAESHWDPSLGVTDMDSTAHQVEVGQTIIASTSDQTPLLLFVNVSALHQPNWFYDTQASSGPDTLHSHRRALAYVDSQLPPLLAALRARAARRQRPCLAIVTSDHGTAYGDDGYEGHRVAHPCVWTVPYAHALLR